MLEHLEPCIRDDFDSVEDSVAMNGEVQCDKVDKVGVESAAHLSKLESHDGFDPETDLVATNGVA